MSFVWSLGCWMSWQLRSLPWLSFCAMIYWHRIICSSMGSLEAMVKNRVVAAAVVAGLGVAAECEAGLSWIVSLDQWSRIFFVQILRLPSNILPSFFVLLQNSYACFTERHHWGSHVHFLLHIRCEKIISILSYIFFLISFFQNTLEINPGAW